MRQTPDQVKKEESQMFLALVLVVFVLIGFQVFNRQPEEKAVPETQPVPEVVKPEIPAPAIVQVPVVSTKELSDVSAQNDFVTGSWSGNGLTLNSLILKKYKETLAKDSPDVVLLSDAYQTRLSWFVSGQEIPLLAGKNASITQNQPATFVSKTKDYELVRTISLDDHYMFTITDTIKNLGKVPLPVHLRGQITRSKDTVDTSRSSVHTGFVALVNQKLEEKRFEETKDKTVTYTTQDGWLGVTDKYWQTVFVPQENITFEITDSQNETNYRTDFSEKETLLNAGQTITRKTLLFAGAKELNLINDYMTLYNIPKFDLTIDFGWFYFLTKPFLFILQWLYKLVGNMGIAILLFATLLRLALLPVATKSYISMAKMRKVQPQLKELQERFKNDRMQLQQEMLALYKREKINPAGGCLPMFIQIPVFYALYKVLSVSLQMRQAPFFGWIQDLSAPDPSSVFTLFGLLQWPIPGFLNIGVLPVIMGITMYIQQKMTPAPTTDKAQANMFKYMPVIFTFMMGQFASGLVIYWTWSNILSIAQQKYIIKKVG
ncbi:MAG: membrane protein insertase YidC [Alphaproteobacteria bacterium]|nr:membrane protein insertase YidC [Alphaproteobacteria bacterium]